MSETTTPRLGAVQVGAVSFVDEGVGPVLDMLQERCGATALFLVTNLVVDVGYAWLDPRIRLAR